MKITVMVNKSAGNSEVGDMWTETFIFDESATLKNVFDNIGLSEYFLKKEESCHNRITMNIAKMMGAEDDLS
jgi:hypothetical protein